MGFMANFEKFTRGDYGLFAHCERKKDENGNYITLGNQRIDPSRSHLNYNMCPEGGEQRDRLEARLSDPNVKCFNRADVIVYGSWCVTLPTHVPMEDEYGNIIYEDKQIHHRDGTVTNETVPRLREIEYTDEQTREFFEISYKFLSERYGEQNVISAYVHMDETTPHMHFLFIPIVPDNKWNEKNPDKPPREKVCAKELMNKTEMSVFHKELQKYMDTHSERGLYQVLNGTTIGGNRTIAELKAESALEEAATLSQQARDMKEKAQDTINEVQRQADETITKIEDHVSAAKDEIDEIIDEYNDWSEKEEKKVRSVVSGLKETLGDMGATEEDEKSLKDLARSLDNPIKGKNGKTYVEIPEPTKMLPLLKKTVQKVLDGITLMKEITKNAKEKIASTKTSIKDLLVQKKAEADRYNQEMRRNRQTKESDRKPHRDGPSL